MAKRIGVKRVAAQIKRVVAEFLQHRIKDPRRGFMTVTRVELSQDYRQCKIFVSVLGGDGDQSRVMHMLDHARGAVQTRVAKALSTRTTPHITFEQDETLEKAIRMESLFDQIARERSEREGSAEASSEDEDGEDADGAEVEDEEDGRDDEDGDEAS